MKFPALPRSLRFGLAALALVCVGLLVGRWTAPEGDAEPASAHDHASHEATDAEKKTVWTCAMHPQIRQPEPGLCPICGMDLVPLKKSDDEPGPRTVVLSERAKALSRLQTAAVTRRTDPGTALRLLGRIEPSETALKNVTAWTAGRIDRLRVKVTGNRIRKGQAVADLYSPEVFAAHQDLLTAGRQIERLSEAAPSARAAAEQALAASKSRLRLLGIPDDEVARMTKADRPTDSVTVRSPFSGTVMERVAAEGAYVQTGALLYTLVDLSSLWVQLDAYESDLPRIYRDQPVTVHVEGLSDDAFTGTVDFVDPTVDPVRRTARVRIALPNKDRRLKPGMFVQAELATDKTETAPLVIPSTAPLFTGRRAVVFVEEPDASRPTYTARTVRLGPKSGDSYPVVSGLSEGDRVVVKGAFALDADLQIRGGHSMMSEPDDRTPDDSAPLPIRPADRRRIGPMLDAYLRLQTALAADDPDTARAAAKEVAALSAKTRIEGPTATTAFWNGLRNRIAASAGAVKEAKSIEAAREAFEPLSEGIISLLVQLGNPLDRPVRLTFCPMAMGDKGAFWVQLGEVVDNPYFGAMMRTCGDIRAAVAPGAYLPAESTAKETTP